MRLDLYRIIDWIVSEIHNIRENYWIGSDKEIKRLAQKINDKLQKR